MYKIKCVYTLWNCFGICKYIEMKLSVLLYPFRQFYFILYHFFFRLKISRNNIYIYICTIFSTWEKRIFVWIHFASPLWLPLSLPLSFSSSSSHLSLYIRSAVPSRRTIDVSISVGWWCSLAFAAVSACSKSAGVVCPAVLRLSAPISIILFLLLFLLLFFLNPSWFSSSRFSDARSPRLKINESNALALTRDNPRRQKSARNHRTMRVFDWPSFYTLIVLVSFY